jgi:hypothetical protein
MRVLTLLLALCLLLCGELQAVAKGSASIRDQPWDAHHIDDLPIEVRQYITGICKGPPRAQHDFATYSPYEKRWRINLEYLQCKGLGEYRREINAWTLISSLWVRVFGLLEKAMPTAASETVGPIPQYLCPSISPTRPRTIVSTTS